MLRKWQKGMTASNVKFDSLSLWVQIWGAPFNMFSPKVAMEVGSRMGVVEEVEKRQHGKGFWMAKHNLTRTVGRLVIPANKPMPLQ